MATHREGDHHAGAREQQRLIEVEQAVKTEPPWKLVEHSRDAVDNGWAAPIGGGTLSPPPRDRPPGRKLKVDNRSEIAAKIRALLAKTVDKGCTEAEAVAAALKRVQRLRRSPS
jgi:hypothetical protein